jgi:hypothetical protein
MKAMWLRRLAAALVLGAMVLGATAEAGKFGAGRRSIVPYSQSVAFYDPAWGNAPHSLVVPPNTRRHVEYQQGVGGTMWQRLPTGYPLEVMGGGPYSPMSAQPYSTNHMGVFYLRGPR